MTTDQTITVTVKPEIDREAVEEAARAAAALFLSSFAVAVLEGIAAEEPPEGPARSRTAPMADLIEDQDGAPYPEGVQAIARERGRQITNLGYSPEHDARHPVRDFVGAAVLLLGGNTVTRPAFTCRPVNPGSGYYERDDLVRAGALIAAAIDRLDTKEKP